MIRFTLACSAGHEFEGWFRNSEGYEEQAAGGSLSCPVCGDREIRKAIMAPAIARASTPAANGAESERRREIATKMLEMMRSVREHVEANFDNVGDRFPEEARKIHYGETEHRDIFGQATGAEVKELLDEGVPVRPLPMLPKLDG